MVSLLRVQGGVRWSKRCPKKGAAYLKQHEAVLAHKLSKHRNSNERFLLQIPSRGNLVHMSLISSFRSGKRKAEEELQRDEGDSSARASRKVLLAVSRFAGCYCLRLPIC